MARENKYLKLLGTMGVTGAAFVVNYLITLVLTPYITDRVGTEAYGFVSLAKNIAQYATIITMALNSFAARYITVAYHKGRIDEANAYFSSTFFGDLLLGGVIFLAALAGIHHLEHIFRIPEALVPDVKRLFLAVFANFLFVTVFTVYGASAFIANKLDVVGMFKALSYIAEAVVLIALFSAFGTKVFYVGIGLAAASCVTVLSNVWICRRYTPELAVRRADYRAGAVRRLVADGVWQSVNDLGSLLHSGLDLTICNLMISPLAMGQLSIAKSIELIFHSLYQLVGQAFQPIFLKRYADGDTDGLLRELKLSMKFSGCLANLAFAGFASLGLAYYRLWIPNQDIGLIYRLTVITVMTNVASGSMNPLYYIYTLTVKKKIPCLVTIVTGLMNVGGMYVLIRYAGMGVDAVVWTTAVLVCFINFVSNPLYMAHVLGLPSGTFYPGIARNVLSCGVLTALFTGFARAYMPGSWPTLILCAVLYAAAGAPVHFLIVLTREDRHRIRAFIQKKRRAA